MKIETRYGENERPTNMSTLKLISCQRKNKKAQLEEQKTSLIEGLTSKITQLQKLHDKIIEAQPKEMKRKRNHFHFKIEMLRARIRELEEKRRGYTENHKENRNRATPELSISELGRRITQRPRNMNATSKLKNRIGKIFNKTQSYASI